MDFIEELNSLSSRASNQIDRLNTEEAAKNALVMPFIRKLGYDPFNPGEVVPEFTADVGTKKGEKVDYAIFKNEKPVMLIECKAPDKDLKECHCSQLYRYFSVTESTVGVLTNGTEYQFFCDIEEDNKMDDKPFLEFDLFDINESVVEELKRFRKSDFEEDEIQSVATNLKYTNELKKIFRKELEDPSKDFVKFFGKQVYNGRFTQNRFEKFTEIVDQALTQFINEKINERLMSAMDQEEETEEEKEEEKEGEEEEEEKVDDGIVTTEEEIEGHHIVKTVLRNFTDPERIALRDYKSFCNILLDDKVTQPIIRFRFDGEQKYVGVFDEEKNEEKIPIDDLIEIGDHIDRMKKSIKYYDTGEYEKESDDDQNLNNS